MRYREIELGVLNDSSGVEARVVKDGIVIGGYYDHFVGIEGRLIPWSEIDAARAFLQSKKPMRDWQPVETQADMNTEAREPRE